MVNIKAQEMTIQTVVVLILILIVLVIVIAFAVPQLTEMFGGIAGVGEDVSGQLPTDVNLTIPGTEPVEEPVE
ncbi:MAG: hypothetical protein PHT91_02905 [Candidatus Nanoarchaeia archaeon]|nr:hypothetical protein [Candidatus Nanoarchaeia archaeon]MDD5054579.1 hypothetical protein [Candidatus Nanoarchaeia archaeon]MDD5499798.1 hypothetical protein [Candidatus Nanoarchaeia archaeon]